MPLLDLWKKDKESFSHFTIDQIVKMAGDGKLKDQSLCSEELRKYLSQTSSEKLSTYINTCLEKSSDKSFPNNGLVFQDLVNELGKRLEYDLTPGLYRGKINAIGFDGIWVAPDDWSIVLEVKTSDFRINLDDIASYRNQLIEKGVITEERSSILFVVGRQDTGDLEAQIRGSRHAWDIRVISAESLMRLVGLKEVSEEEETLIKIRDILKPFEYTRLDNIIDLVFSAAKDVESASEFEPPENTKTEDLGSRTQEHTPAKVMAEIRNRIVDFVANEENKTLIAKTRSLFWNPDHSFRVAISISKPYGRNGQNYWYGFRPNWKNFLQEEADSYYALGFVNSDKALIIPSGFFLPLLKNLRTTDRDGEVSHWHVHIDENENGELFLRTPVDNTQISLQKFLVKI